MASLAMTPIATSVAAAAAGKQSIPAVQLAQLDGNSLLLMLPDSLDQARGQQKLEPNRKALERDPGSPVAGNPDGDVTIVEFFDYRCLYCRRFMDRLASLLEVDHGLRFVFKEWPMFGGVSVTAARAALAADRQGRYLEMHKALMVTRLLTEAVILVKAGELGLDLPRLRLDMTSPEVDRQLAATAGLAEELGFRGTPMFVVDQRILRGLPDDTVIAAAVAAARADRRPYRSGSAPIL